MPIDYVVDHGAPKRTTLFSKWRGRLDEWSEVLPAGEIPRPPINDLAPAEIDRLRRLILTRRSW